MNWKTSIIELNNRQKYSIQKEGKPINFQTFIKDLQTNPEFCIYFNQLLVNCPYKAFYWEVKATTIHQLDQLFEFVLTPSNSLAQVPPRPSAFQQYFEANKNVVSFPNLRGDAQLVVPTPISEDVHYTHIGTFVRNAPEEQIIDFWKKVGEVYESQLQEKPKWLSTHGMGVYWLHVRVDSIPKYYSYTPYK